MNKLTAQIAAAYWRSAVISETPFKEVHERYLIEMGQGRCDNDKLLLTPLAKITKEYAIEVAKILNCYVPDNAFLSIQERDARDNWARLSYKVRGNEIIIANFSDKITHISGSSYFEDYIKAIDYLRSKSYDCGYAEIQSLIAVGIAFDKTLLKSQQ